MHGDFNRDGIADIAIGVPNEDVGAVGDAGAVNVLYGTATGLSGSNYQVWTQNSPSVEDVAEISICSAIRWLRGISTATTLTILR